MKKILLTVLLFSFILPVQARELTQKEREYLGIIVDIGYRRCIYTLNKKAFSYAQQKDAEEYIAEQVALAKVQIENKFPEFLENFDRDFMLSTLSCTIGIKNY